MAKNPTAEDLIRRPLVEKPQEEYLLPADTEEVSIDDYTPVTPEVPLSRQIQDEVQAIDELLALIEETADTVSVDVPEEFQEHLGVKKITTQGYFKAAREKNHSIEEVYEHGILDGCSATHNWTALAAPDLVGIRENLLAVRRTSAPLTSTQDSTKSTWKSADESKDSPPAEGPDAEAQKTAVSNSQKYRAQFQRAVRAMGNDFKSEVFHSVMDRLQVAVPSRVLAEIDESVRLLQSMRGLLCYAQFLSATRFFDARTDLVGILKDVVLRQAVQILGRAMNQVEGQVVQPVLSHLAGLSRDEGGIKDIISQAAANTLLHAASALVQQRQAIYADLIRGLNQDIDQRIEKITALGDRAVIGRWITHINEAIMMLESARRQSLRLDDLTQKIQRFKQQSLPPPDSRLYEQIDSLDTARDFSERPGVPDSA